MSNKRFDFLDTLNDRQREAVMHEGSPLLILAGAGSGKTRVITTKIAWLIAEGKAEPRDILAVTFTNKAAGEMLHRVVDMVPEAHGIIIRTFHSFGAWLLRRYPDAAGIDRRFTIYDDDDALSLLHSAYGVMPKRELSPYSKLISRAKDYNLAPGDDLSSVSGNAHFPQMYDFYQKRLEEVGNVDFGDLIMRPVMLLRTSSEIRTAIRSRFRIILVDEYQDSNVAQYELLKALAGPDTYLCVVGDDDQSIYRFRGAEVRNILTFPDIFPNTHIIRLEQNYRSTENILALASHVVQNNRGRLGKTLWTAKKGGKRPILAFLSDQDEEARFCADLLTDGNLANTAILYRTNAQSLAFESLFTRMNIPYRIVGALRFYEREEIKDSIAFMSLFVNPRDEIAFKRIVNKPARGIGQVTVQKIIDASSGGDLIEGARVAMKQMSPKSEKAVGAFLSILDQLENELESSSLSDFVHHLMKISGLLEYHAEQDEIAGTFKVRNMEELVSAAADFTGGMEGILQFLETIELDRSRFDAEEDDGRDRITLITMHNTKGLEFGRIVITGMDEGIFPGWRNEDEADIEEERRIFYVSITRAKKELYLTSCRTRRLWGRISFFTPSRFLSEIPGGLLTYIGRDSRLPAEAGSAGDQTRFSPGTRIYHDDYGYGMVVKNWYNGSELSVLVRFDTGQTAQFLPKYTPLERIGSDD